jgi:formate hydrogenlyase transcriptional activator
MVRCPNSPAQHRRSRSRRSYPHQSLEQAERSHILQTLQQMKGMIGGRNGAAARLGLPRTTLIYKMKRLHIKEQPRLRRGRFR